MRPIFRFAPTPNGRLHLGHAYSALCNERAARAGDGVLRLRLEDTDAARARPAFADAIAEDLDWLGVAFEGATRRQSEHMPDYAQAFDRLAARGLVFPCHCTRAGLLASNGGARDPDGAPLHFGRCDSPGLPGEAPAWRLDAQRASAEMASPLFWREYGEGDVGAPVQASPLAWGDIVLRGKERAATYHLAVVVDDAIQGVTDVVRGRDLLAATSVHVLLQALLALDTPRYRHHRLVMDASGAKMSKSAASQPISALREAGLSAGDLRAALGFAPPSGAEFAVRLS